MFKFPEQYRLKGHGTIGENGAFIVPLKFGRKAKIIASNGLGWEHVSVSILNKNFTPSWEEMHFIKCLFWGEDCAVMQLHPPKSDYINNHLYCLHLWRPINKEIPLPPSELVGLKKINIK